MILAPYASGHGTVAPSLSTQLSFYPSTLCSPVPHGVHDWKARISIKSLAPAADPPSALAQLEPTQSNGLTPHLCYACHITLTSRSSRGTRMISKPSSSSDKVLPNRVDTTVILPIWVQDRLSGLLPDISDRGKAVLGSEGKMGESKRMCPDEIGRLSLAICLPDHRRVLDQLIFRRSRVSNLR